MEILEHHSLRLILQFEGEDVKIISRQLTNEVTDTFSMERPALISYEFKSNDTLRSAGSLPLMRGTTELFVDSKGKINQQVSARVNVSIVVPNEKGKNELLFFRDGVIDQQNFNRPLRPAWKQITFQN